jgi:signal transduction histidine kinase
MSTADQGAHATREGSLHDWVASLLCENADLVEELRASRRRIVEAAQRERRRLEQDLHDGAQQRLMGIQIKLRMAEQLAPDGDLAELLEAIDADAAQAVDELRMLARGIYPPALRDFGPADALRAVAAGSPVAVRVVDRGVGRTSDPIEAAVYFCACEAIQNAAKHAGPGASVTVTLGRHQSTLEFAVVDDGNGFVIDGAARGIGLTGMRDRVEAVGGCFRIDSTQGKGTCVHVTIPNAPSRAVRHRQPTIAMGSRCVDGDRRRIAS